MGHKTSTSQIHGHANKRFCEDTDQNPPSDALPSKWAMHLHTSSTNEESQPLPLTEADIPLMVDIQGLTGKQVTATPS